MSCCYGLHDNAPMMMMINKHVALNRICPDTKDKVLNIDQFMIQLLSLNGERNDICEIKIKDFLIILTVIV